MATAMLGSPGIERDRLGAQHVRIETAQPEQSGRAAAAAAYRDPAAAVILANLDEGRFRGSCGRMGHDKILGLSAV
jgi:hypothetical protein